MAHPFSKLALLAPSLAIIAGCSSVSASTESVSDGRALSLNVIETADSVEIEVIANSQVTQQITFTAELTGTSVSRHKSSTSIAAGNRQVLSRMKTSAGDNWCATVDVSEASGEKYTLTAGECGLL